MEFIIFALTHSTTAMYISSLMQMRHNSSASAMELCLFCIKTSISSWHFCLQCNCQYSSLKRRPVSDEEDDEYDDSDDELDSTLMTRSSKYLKTLAYYVTDIERFQPPRKRPK